MDEIVTGPRAVGSNAPMENEGFSPLNWPLTGVAALGEANMHLALTLADRLSAAFERLVQIGEKVLTECDAEGRVTLRRAFKPDHAAIADDDVRPGQWEDIIADFEEWRLEVTEGLVAAWQDWQSALAARSIGNLAAQGPGELLLTPWPATIAGSAGIDFPNSDAGSRPGVQ